MSYDDEKFEPTQEIVFEEDDVIEDFDFPEEMDEDIVIEDDGSLTINYWDNESD